MSNKIQVFDLSNASDVSLTSTGFKKGDDTAKYVCKITDATIVFVGDNSKFVTDNKKKFLMRRREIVDRTVNTKVRSNSK